MSIKSSIFNIETLTEGRKENKKEIARRFLGITGSNSHFDGKIQTR